MADYNYPSPGFSLDSSTHSRPFHKSDTAVAEQPYEIELHWGLPQDAIPGSRNWPCIDKVYEVVGDLIVPANYTYGVCTASVRPGYSRRDYPHKAEMKELAIRGDDSLSVQMGPVLLYVKGQDLAEAYRRLDAAGYIL